MVNLVETVMTADSLQITACGSGQLDALVYGLTEKEIRIVEGGRK
jgi:hypothetical protein